MDPIAVLGFLLAGAALGAVYFALLRLSLPNAGASSVATTFVPLFLARFALAAGVFWVIAQHGAAPLLIALAGFLLARVVAKRAIRVE
jgi:F1F0 ATPase subunit 2